MAGQKRSTLIAVDDAAFQSGLAAALRGLKLSTESQVARLGLDVQNRARQLCPVDTGRLRSSVNSSGLQRDGRGVFVEVGTNVVYGTHVEFGTSRQRAQPYLRPALAEAVGAASGGQYLPKYGR
jgi:HK97 gp10 family phage protein